MMMVVFLGSVLEEKYRDGRWAGMPLLEARYRGGEDGGGAEGGRAQRRARVAPSGPVSWRLGLDRSLLGG